MRSNQRNEIAGGDDFGLLPELWEMALVARHEIIGAGRIRAFQEDVVIGIARRRVFGAMGETMWETFSILLKELVAAGLYES